MEAFQQKIVLITGAAGGFGRAIAHAFAQAGACLALLDRDARGLEEVATLLRLREATVRTVVADLSTAQGVQEGVQAVLDPYDRHVDILIANVGVLVAGNFAEISDTQIEVALTMNFLTHVWTCRTVLPLMANRPGANIVLVGSDQGTQPDVGLFPYAQAKAALHSLTRLLAREYGPAIRINAIAPGMSRTALVEELMQKLAHDWQTDRIGAEQRELQRRGVTLRRLGEPEEIAEAVLFLASNPFCTGTLLDISGGNIRGL